MNTRASHSSTPGHQTYSTTPPRQGSSLTLPTTLLLFLLTTAANAQEPAATAVAPPDRSDVARLRESTRLLLGTGVVTGDLEFTSSAFNLKADLGELTSLSVGLQAWPREYAGFDLLYQTGLFGSLAVPQLEVQSGDADLALVSHRFEGSFLYRWFTGPRPESTALGARVGFILHNITTSDHSPTVALTTTWFGPSLGPFLNLAALDGDIGLHLRADLIAPFFVRESPQRSGAPRDPFGYHLGAAPYLRLATHWFLVVHADLHSYSADFEGTGNRWYGDIQGGSTKNSFLSAQLAIEWLLD